MKFYALAYQFEEDIFYDFATEEDTHDLTETCFLPTKTMAEKVIEEELSTDYVPVEIELERLERNGVWTYSRGTVEGWDEEY